MSVKDVLQSLVDDNLVDSERIGTSNYFWSFPSKAVHTVGLAGHLFKLIFFCIYVSTRKIKKWYKFSQLRSLIGHQNFPFFYFLCFYVYQQITYVTFHGVNLLEKSQAV